LRDSTLMVGRQILTLTNTLASPNTDLRQDNFAAALVINKTSVMPIHEADAGTRNVLQDVERQQRSLASLPLPCLVCLLGPAVSLHQTFSLD
jgi:hypothetical protein